MRQRSTALESIVICDDLVGYARKIAGGIEVNDETLALDVVDAVGPGGNYLMEEHTLKYFKKETWYPALFERKIYEKWEAEGQKTLNQRANARVIDILESHQTESLAKDVQSKIKKIIEGAEQKIPKT